MRFFLTAKPLLVLIIIKLKFIPLVEICFLFSFVVVKISFFIFFIVDFSFLAIKGFFA